MKLPIKLLAAGASLCLSAGVAHAQAAAPSAGPASNFGGGEAPNPSVSPRDTSELDIMRDRDERNTRAERRARRGKPSAVPAKPEEVVAQSQVRDIQGQIIGSVESVSLAAAVVATGAGKVEVPLESFGKDDKGLMIAMSKADFDAAVAAATAAAQ